MSNRLISFYNYSDATGNNGSKRNPGLSADVLGDWREEVILRSADSTKLLLFTTVIPSSFCIYTLMHDP
jgi:rhamnogalacturonan endolyase